MRNMKRLLAMALALVMALALSCGTLAFAAPGDIETGVGGNEGDFTDPVPQPDPDPDIPPVGPTYCTVTFESDEEKGELEGQTQITVTPGSKIPENRVPEVIEAVEGTFLGWVIEGREDEGLVDFDTLRVNTSITLIAVYEDAPQEDEGLLNKADHIAYMQGDGDSTFRPNDSLTRAEAATVFYNLLLDQDVEITVSFTDVSEDAWYVEQVGVLASLGIIQGDGDGTFRPGDTISRAEFATMAAKFENLEEGSVSFSDVPESHWA